MYIYRVFSAPLGSGHASDHQPTTGYGKRRKFPERSPGQSSGRKQVSVHFEFEKKSGDTDTDTDSFIRNRKAKVNTI